MNGASDTLGQVLGKDVGACHARSAIGTNSLPLGICVEVEMIAKISVQGEGVYILRGAVELL